MKNRKLFIIGFLVVATIVTGVGFAALNGDITIAGNAAYYGASYIEDLNPAYYLKVSVAEKGDWADVEVRENVVSETSYYHDVTLYIDFIDADGKTTVQGQDYDFIDVTTLTISYGADAEESVQQTLPTIHLDQSVVTAVAQQLTGQDVKGTFMFDATWGGNVSTETFGETTEVTLQAGDSITLVLTTTYKKPTIGENFTADDLADLNDNATIQFELPWHLANQEGTGNGGGEAQE